MYNRFWLARAARGSMKIEGLIETFATEQAAQESRIELQGNSRAGLSGDIFVVIDSLHLPLVKE